MGCVGRGGRGVASRPGRRKLRCEKRPNENRWVLARRTNEGGPQRCDFGDSKPTRATLQPTRAAVADTAAASSRSHLFLFRSY